MQINFFGEGVDSKCKAEKKKREIVMTLTYTKATYLLITFYI